MASLHMCDLDGIRGSDSLHESFISECYGKARSTLAPEAMDSHFRSYHSLAFLSTLGALDLMLFLKHSMPLIDMTPYVPQTEGRDGNRSLQNICR